MRLIGIAIIMLTMMIAPASTLEVSSIRQHYQAYLSALDRGDLQTAVNEAQAALDASVAQDGDGGSTAVLSLNMATTLLLSGQPVEARQHAERALALARNGANGVNPVFADLVAARAELGATNEPSAADRLAELLAGADLNDIPAADIYAAASHLGNWGFGNQRHDIARTAWRVASDHPEGSQLGEAYGLGRAKTNEAVAIIVGELDRRGGGRIDREEAEVAHALLSEASLVLWPLSQRETPELELTIAQQVYSEARVWLLALRNKLRADGQRLPETPAEVQGDADGLTELGPVDITQPRCLMRVVPRPMPHYPRDSQVAAVMMFFRVNDDGSIAARQIVARAGAEEFAEAIERVADHWRVERLEQSPANCRMRSSILQPVSFQTH
jgi:hypothetical protein